MTSETQVPDQISEVAKPETDEISGSDVNSYQDLSKSNGINPVGEHSDCTDDPIDNSYVFVSGADDAITEDPLNKVVPIVDSDESPESLLPSQNHVNSVDSNIAKGDILDSSVPETHCNVEGSDSIPVNNEDSLREEDRDAVQIAPSDSLEDLNGGVGNTDAEPEQIEDQLDSKSSPLHSEDQEPQAGSTDSVEQPNEIEAASTDIKPEPVEDQNELEASVQPTINQEFPVEVLEANTDLGGSKEVKGASPDINDTDDQYREFSSSEVSAELSQGLDSQVLVLKANDEAADDKKLSSEFPDINNSGSASKVIEESGLQTSEELSLSPGCQVVVLEANAESEYESNSESSAIKETVYEIKESNERKLEESNELNEVKDCKTMDLKIDVESEDSAEPSSLLPDVKQTGYENVEIEEKNLEVSQKLIEVQESQLGVLEANKSQPTDIESPTTTLEEQKDLEASKETGEQHKSQDVVLEIPARQSAQVEVWSLSSEPQSEEKLLQQVPLSGSSEMPGAVSSDSGFCQVDETREEFDEEEMDDLCLEKKGDHELDTTFNEDIHVNSCTQQKAMSSVKETDKPLGAENVDDTVYHINKCDSPVPNSLKCASETDEPHGCSDGNENSVEVNGSSGITESLSVVSSMGIDTEIDSNPVKCDESSPSVCADVMTAQHEIEPQESIVSDANHIKDVVPSPVDDTRLGNIVSEVTVDNGLAGHHSMPNCNDNDAVSGMEIAVETIDSKTEAIQCDLVDTGNEKNKGDAESDHSDSVSVNLNVDSEVEVSTTVGSRDIHSDDLVVSGTVVLDNSVDNKEGSSNLVEEIADVENIGNEFNFEDRSGECNVISQENAATEASHTSEVLASSEYSTAQAKAGQDVAVEAMTRPFNFLIKVPRFDDEKLREQIRHAQLQVEEKTQSRDAFRLQIQKKRGSLRACGVEYDAAISEEKDARRSVKAKRMEIESLQSLINRVKNAISVEDIDARIFNMEHMMQHETLPLKEEKQFIREIKQLKQHREQLSSNIGRQEEIQQAMDQKDQIEDQLKVLKRELESLKTKVLKAQAAAEKAGRKYEDENKKIKELQNQFKAADDIRQEAYAKLLSLRRELFEKNKHFRLYKDDAAAASDYALNRNREALHQLCINQVETIMDIWNKNEEFRKEYVRCNLRSTVRRLGTLDGRSLGPDEEPPVLPSNFGKLEKSSSLLKTSAENKTEVVPPATVVVADGKSMAKAAESEKQIVKTREPAKSTLGNGLASSLGPDMTTDVKEKPVQTKEELELARKAEALRKEEESAKIKEQRRLEEIAKAKEALERKRRIAEKAQMRAELRAQKEAEQKEKEREKRLRKKERKKAGAADAHEGSNDGEIEQSSESVIETVKEPEVETPAATKRPQKTSQFVKQSKSKSIPPPLRNRSRRKMQQWMWVIFTSALVIALFLLGNIGVFSNLRQRKSGF